MSTQKPSSPDSTATSQGHSLAESAYLDNHFLTCQPEYGAILRSVGIEAGWSVLDAGCGGGSFLPLIAELVGPGGKIDALDLAPENIAVVESEVRAGRFHCPVAPRIGSVTALPYDDHTYDAVWSTAVTQYLTDKELGACLAEFRRVTRPGGIVAIKEWDPTGFQVQPTTPMLAWHWQEMNGGSGSSYAHGVLRALTLPQWFREAGFVDIRRKNTLTMLDSTQVA